jgi:hypothetical protein
MAGFSGTRTASASGMVHVQAAASTGGLRTCSLPQRGHVPTITSLTFLLLDLSIACSPFEVEVKTQPSVLPCLDGVYHAFSPVF